MKHKKHMVVLIFQENQTNGAWRGKNSLKKIVAEIAPPPQLLFRIYIRNYKRSLPTYYDNGI